MNIIEFFQVSSVVGVTLLTVFAVFKNFLQKSIEEMISNSSQKVLLQFEDKLARNIKAYEILLNKEFEFYEKTSAYIGSLIQDIQDLCDYLQNKHNDIDGEHLIKASEFSFKILGRIPKFKNEILSSQPFIPDNIFSLIVKLITYQQTSMKNLNSIIIKSGDQKEFESNITVIDDISECTLIHCTIIQHEIKERISAISK